MFDTMTVEKLDFVDDILGQGLAVPLFIKFSISFNSLGGHLLDLCSSGGSGSLAAARQWQWQRSSGSS